MEVAIDGGTATLPASGPGQHVVSARAAHGGITSAGAAVTAEA